MNDDNVVSAGLGSTSIRRWLEAVGGREVSTGLHVEEATRRAEISWRRLQNGETPHLESDTWADEIHAISKVAGLEVVASEARLRAMSSFYGFVDQFPWTDDDLDERAGVLSKIAYLGWLDARRSGANRDALLWEERVTANVLSQESIKAFLEMRAKTRSHDLNLRFLSDPAVLLVACLRLGTRVNDAPLLALREAELLRSWLIENPLLTLSDEEAEYFAAELTWIVAAATKHCGRYRDCQRWLRELQGRFRSVKGSDSLRARARYLQLAVLYQLRSYEEVLQGIPEFSATLARLEMRTMLAKCRYLQAITLKELQRDHEARLIFLSLSGEREVQRESWLYALVLMGIAELDGRVGEFAAAQTRLRAAEELLGQSDAPFVVAHLHGLRGELLRDQGRLTEAAESYRAGVDVYVEAGMAAMGAYLRVVLAETLLAAGREDHAMQEIVAALPTIDRGGLMQEAIAAIALLRESVRRHKVDPFALRTLREFLDRAQKGSEP